MSVEGTPAPCNRQPSRNSTPQNYLVINSIYRGLKGPTLDRQQASLVLTYSSRVPRPIRPYYLMAEGHYVFDAIINNRRRNSCGRSRKPGIFRSQCLIETEFVLHVRGSRSIVFRTRKNICQTLEKCSQRRKNIPQTGANGNGILNFLKVWVKLYFRLLKILLKLVKIYLRRVKISLRDYSVWHQASYHRCITSFQTWNVYVDELPQAIWTSMLKPVSPAPAPSTAGMRSDDPGVWYTMLKIISNGNSRRCSLQKHIERRTNATCKRAQKKFAGAEKARKTAH